MNISELKPLFPEEYTDGGPLVIAGPCSAESETQVLDAAHALMNEGIRIVAYFSCRSLETAH